MKQWAFDSSLCVLHKLVIGLFRIRKFVFRFDFRRFFVQKNPKVQLSTYYDHQAILSRLSDSKDISVSGERLTLSSGTTPYRTYRALACSRLSE